MVPALVRYQLELIGKVHVAEKQKALTPVYFFFREMERGLTLLMGLSLLSGSIRLVMMFHHQLVALA
jgi:hypothetical protein